MWWMAVALAASGAGYEPKVAVPVIDTDANVAVGAVPLATDFELPAGRGRDEYRLRALDRKVEASDPRDPFSVSALADERQRLTFGVKPGLRRARIGMNYSLALD